MFVVQRCCALYYLCHREKGSHVAWGRLYWQLDQATGVVLNHEYSILVTRRLSKRCVWGRQEQAREEERKYGVEDSRLPGAGALPPTPSPVGAGLLPATALSGECALLPRSMRHRSVRAWWCCDSFSATRAVQPHTGTV